jgi:transcriptional regulator with PAS, ATPase and Fis domain
MNGRFLMNNEIIFISTTTGVTNKIKQILEERELDYPIYEATMSRAYAIAKKSIEMGTKIIVCRGGTTAYLRGKVDVPVVDIRHGFIDIHLTVEKAEKISDKIAFVGYSNLCEAAQDYCKIMKKDIPIAIVKSDGEIEVKLDEYIKNGIQVVMGGLQLAEVAKKYNVTQVMGEADPAAINQSINEALHDLKIEHERKERYETINSILNCTSEGIVGIEKDGSIMHINEIAKQILNYDGEKNINELLPDSNILKPCDTGEENINEFLEIGNNSIVVNSIPIRLEDRIIGAVATIQEQNKILSVDFEIRKKLLGSGHVAKKTFKDIVGESVEINEVIKRASKYAKTDSTILILGETGTGKEIFAQSIHNFSNRKNQPFVAINCAALPENILESELFGYVKGAFTGARTEGKPGIFELAHNGTVFLDEIGEVSTSVQAKLLRVLQEREVSRIGDDKVIPVDVRILAATNKNLVTEISKGKFREDLYFRICILELEIPPLRKRKDDIKELIRYFAKEKTRKRVRFSERALDLLSEYDWPGNIRQLSNVVERLVIICEDENIDEETVSEALKNMDFKQVEMPLTTERSLSSETEKMLLKIIDKLAGGNVMKDDDEEFLRNNQISFKKVDLNIPQEGIDLNDYIFEMEKKIIKNTLDKMYGSRDKTAEFLGISPATLWRKMKKMNII